MKPRIRRQHSALLDEPRWYLIVTEDTSLGHGTWGDAMQSLRRYCDTLCTHVPTTGAPMTDTALQEATE